MARLGVRAWLLGMVCMLTASSAAGQGPPFGPPLVPAAQPPANQPAANQPAANQPAAPPAQPRPGEVRPQQQPAQVGPRANTPAEAAFLDQVLQVWESESDKVKSYKGPFERWEYNPVWNPGVNEPRIKSQGMLKYLKPDKGEFEVTLARHYNPENQQYEEKKGDVLDHWVCDGKAVYEYDSLKKQLIVRHLPPDMQGAAIVDGPLPFLFGAKKEKLKQRYFFNVTKSDQETIWLEAWPRFQRDAANFQRVELILNRQKFLPSAMQVYLPAGGVRTVYLFDLKQAKINDPLDRFLGSFQSPRTPINWKRVEEKAPEAPPQQAARPRANPVAPPQIPLR